MMRALAARAWFFACLTLGRLLRSARYSEVRIVREGSELQVRKRRLFFAPLLVAMSGPLARVLDTGVRVLPQREWEERERELHARVHGSSIRIDGNATLVLPFLEGQTLAALLGDRRLDESSRKMAIELAVLALVELHRAGVTHGDAMAENVMVDIEAGVAHWFDFETVHDSGRAMAWRRADDVRTLLVTCLLRVTHDAMADTLNSILDLYADADVTSRLGASFASTFRRPLAFHLGQAGVSHQCFRRIDRLLHERLDARPKLEGGASAPPNCRSAR